MTLTVNELRQLKGVGRIIAERLLEQGFDSFKKIAAADETKLRMIKGINPNAIPSMIEQAATLASAVGVNKAARVEAMKKEMAEIRSMFEAIVTEAHHRFAGQLEGKCGEKLTKDIVRAMDTLNLVEEKVGKRVKRTAAGVAKAKKRMEKLASSDLEVVRKGLKKARKALKQVLA